MSFALSRFQATLAIVLSFIICIVLGPRVIAWLRYQKIGDQPKFDHAEIDKLMEGKKGVPTMGGLFIITSIVVTVLLLADLSNFYVEMGLLCLIWLGIVGAIDDWLKSSPPAAARIAARGSPAARNWRFRSGWASCFLISRGTTAATSRNSSISPFSSRGACR